MFEPDRSSANSTNNCPRIATNITKKHYAAAAQFRYTGVRSGEARTLLKRARFSGGQKAAVPRKESPSVFEHLTHGTPGFILGYLLALGGILWGVRLRRQRPLSLLPGALVLTFVALFAADIASMVIHDLTRHWTGTLFQALYAPSGPAVLVLAGVVTGVLYAERHPLPRNAPAEPGSPPLAGTDGPPGPDRRRRTPLAGR